jgi:hypothetical protein
VITSSPPLPAPTGDPSSFTTSIEIPGMGTCALPGLVVVIPGSGLTMMAPVSVCHQVSTIGADPPPMTSRYQIQASGLMGSPTLPSTRMLERSKPSGTCRPTFMNDRMAVGAV